MIIYQEKQKTVNTGIEITNYEYVQEKAQDGLLHFFYVSRHRSNAYDARRRCGAVRWTQGKHNTTGRIGYRHRIKLQLEDPLNDAVMARLLAGESTRKYSNTVGANGQGAVCTSKSEVSRRFIKEMDKLMEEFLTRPFIKA